MMKKMQFSPDRSPWLRLCLACLIGALAAVPAMAQTRDANPQAKDSGAEVDWQARMDDLLVAERWRDPSYGVGVRLPQDSQYTTHTADDAALRVQGVRGRDRYAIRMRVKKSSQPIDLDTAVESVIVQMSMAKRSTIIDGDAKPFDVDPYEGALIYFLVPEDKQPARVLGHALVKVRDDLFVSFELEVEHRALDNVRPVFETLVQSLDMLPPEELDKQREREVEAGAPVLEAMTAQAMRDHLRAEQWYRIVEEVSSNRKPRDIGYMRLAQQEAQMMGMPGLRMDVQARLHLEDTVYETTSTFWLSEDQHHEVWSVETISRPGDLDVTPSQRATLFFRARPGARDAQIEDFVRRPDLPLVDNRIQAWSELGVRSRNDIQVTFKGPSSTRDYEWQKPEKGYLSQLQVHLIESMLGDFVGQTMGFYAYYPQTGDISYRSLAVEEGSDQGYRVRLTTGASQFEQISDYDARGNLLKRTLTGSRTVVPSSQSQIERQWRLKYQGDKQR